MSETESHFEVERGSERGFGIVFAVVFSLIGLYPLLGGGPVRLWAIAIALALLAVAFVMPRLLAEPNKLWFKFGMALGHVVSIVVMTLIYFLTFVPTGLLLRLFGKDLLRDKAPDGASTYWIKRTEPMGSMRNQF